MKGCDDMYEEITKQARTVVTELLDQANMKPGSLLVIGCSSSEMVGKRIGKGSSMEAAQAAADQYLENITTMEKETKQRCEEMLRVATRDAKRILDQAQVQSCCLLPLYAKAA